MYIYVQFEDVKYEIYSDILFHISGNIHRCGGKSLSRIWLLVTSWAIVHQAPLSMEFPRLENWSGLPIPPPRDFSDPGIKPESPALQADSSPSEPPGKHA